jgi:hypothetical protein
MIRTGFIAWIAITLLACSGSEDAEPTAPPITYQESPKPGAAKLTGHAPTATELPVTEDFDEASEREITAENFRAELDRLEAEITGDTAD